MPKTFPQKATDAFHKELSDRGLKTGGRRPFGIKPIYHETFAPYLFWMVTGQGKHPFNPSETAQDFYGPRPPIEGVIPWLQHQLSEEQEPQVFNAYSYLLNLLNQESKEAAYHSSQLEEVKHWLATRAAFADDIAYTHSPALYNVPAYVPNASQEGRPVKRTPTDPVAAEQAPVEQPAPNARTAQSSSAGTGLPDEMTPLSDLPTAATQDGLSASDRILGPAFTLAEADALALQVGLVDEAGRFHPALGERKLGAIVGFCLALQRQGKLVGTIPELTDVIGPRYGVVIHTRKTSTDIAQRFLLLTERAIGSQNR